MFGKGLVCVRIRIISNNLEEKINTYQKQTGASKTWIASKLEMSPQRLYSLAKADNMMVDIALKFAEFLDCDVKDLFEYEKVE